jgi:hypothetical protein
MTKIKTTQNDNSVDAFIKAIKDEARQADARALVKLMVAATGVKPKMWGTSIVGCGERHYAYANGKPGVMCKVGFAPRAKSFALYLAKGSDHAALIKQLGKHKYSGGCLHITRLADVQVDVLLRMIKSAFVKPGDAAGSRASPSAAGQ